MYEQFYGFRKRPFSLNPDPSCLYLSDKHKTALSLMEYALINQAACCVIIGEIGTGKTTLVRQLLNQLDDDFTVGLLTNTHPSFGEVLKLILLAFGLEYEGKDKVDQYRLLQDYLIQQHSHDRKSLLIVDEAQNMTPTTLEELRMLSNINVDKHNVLQMILVGQEGLHDMLRRPELEQFAQRIAVDYCLQPLDRVESHAYILHRLELAGKPKCRKIFDQEVCDIIFQCTGGVPRVINMLCDLALVYGYADQKPILDPALINQVIRDKKQGGIFPLREDVAPLEDADLEALRRLHSLGEDELIGPVPYDDNREQEPVTTVDTQAVSPPDPGTDRAVIHSMTDELAKEDLSEHAQRKQPPYNRLRFTHWKPHPLERSTLHTQFKSIQAALKGGIKSVLCLSNPPLHQLKTAQNHTTTANFKAFFTGSLELFRTYRKVILIAGLAWVAINMFWLFTDSKSFINRTTANAVTPHSSMTSEPSVSEVPIMNHSDISDIAASKEMNLASLTTRSLSLKPTPPKNNEASKVNGKPPVTKSENFIVVQKGNTLSMILAQAYGKVDEILIKAVLHANPQILDPDMIRVGQQIKLPEEHLID
jgi:general secretion pathway protein A